MKTLLISLILLFNLNLSFASDEHVHEHEEHNIRLLETYDLGDGAFMYLSVRDNGHVLGQKFVVETRLSCDGEVQNFSELEVKDSYSVCNMKPESITKNEKGTAVAMIAKSANINKYYDDIGEGLVSPEINCKAENELLKFSLKTLCKASN